MFRDAREFPFTRTLESHWQAIRQEFERLSPEQLMPWPEKDIYNTGWEVFGLWGAERRFEANCQLCSATTAALEHVPGLTTAGFSRLAPGTHIRPHQGYTDTVLRCHLGLVVPEGCGLEVGGETRHWQEGRCLVFDDTTRHSAWNDSSAPRIILMLDFVRPGRVFDARISAEAEAVIEALSREVPRGAGFDST